MKIKDIILEMAQGELDQLDRLKTVLASKIKQLPDDETTAKALIEIEELLQYVGAGGRKGMIDKKLQEIGDSAVDKFRKELARYLLSILEDKPIKERDELFAMWKADQIVNIDVLLSKKPHSFEQIFNGYGKNSALTELIDDLMQIQALGQGKGELALNVLSKKIHKPAGSYNVNQDAEDKEDAKGDLIIDGKKIELKTTDIGGARFVDQEVKPAVGYEEAARQLRGFIMNNREVMPDVRLQKSGINARELIAFYGAIQDPAVKKQYRDLVEKNTRLIFGGDKADNKLVNGLMNAFESQDVNEFLQLFSTASLEYYLSIKEDEGVINLDIPKKQALFYRTAQDLYNVKHRFHADSFYFANNNAREVYPKLKVVPTTFVAEPEGREKQKAARAQVATLPSAQDPVEIEQTLQTVVSDLAAAKGVTNPAKVRAMFDSASAWLASQKGKIDKIKPNSLEQHLETQGFFDDNQPDELDQIVKNAGIAKPAVPGAATV